MGARVQHKSFPGDSSMMDLNEDADSSWSRNYEDKMLGAHFCNLRPENGYSEYDREMLKRTMLEHEAIFRKQVYELHRLYRIQKDLMDDFQQKGLYRYFAPRNASQSNSFSSPMPPEYTKMIWRMPQLPGPTNGYNGVPFTGTNDMSPLSKANSERPCQFQFPIETGSLRKDSDVQDLKLNKFPRKMFDLQLPADVYIDNEDTDNRGEEPSGKPSLDCTVPSEKHYCAESQNDVKLTLGTGECSDLLQDRGKSNSHKHWLDSNKSNGELLHEIALGSPSHFFCPKTRPQESQAHLFPLKSTTSFLVPQSALSKHRHGDEGSFSKYPFVDKGEIKEAWAFNNNEDGESRKNVSLSSSGLCNGKLPISFDPMQFKSIESHQAHSFNKAEAWITPRPSIEASQKISCVGITNNPGPAVSGTSCSFAVPYLDYTCTTSALVSAPKQGNNISHMASTLSCFSEYATMNKQSQRSFTATQDSGNTIDRWRYSADLRPCLRIDSEGTSYADGFGHPYQLGSSSACFGKFNLKGDGSSLINSDGYDPQKRFKGLYSTNMMSSTDGSVNQALQNGIRDGPTEQDKCISSIDGKYDVSSEKISWFSSKPASNDSVKLNKYVSQMDLSFSQGYLQLIPKTSASGPKLEWKQQEKSLPISNIQDLPSTSRVENRMLINGANDSMRSTKILGFPILDKIQKNVICSASHQEQSAIDDNSSREKVGSNYIDLCTDTNVPSLENPIPEGDLVRTNSSRVRNHINLNSTCMENPISTELSPEGVVEVPSRLALPNLSPKVVPEIDLEAPVIFQAEEENFPSEGCLPSDKTDRFEQKECSHEALVKEAAESIIHMSLDRGSSFDSRCSSLPPSPSDTLQWFAEVVSSNTGQARVLGKEDGCCEFLDDELDHFELMTLKLEELKADDYLCKPWEPVNQEEEQKDKASLLLSKPRRGQARRRRQRDFQKDILPGLASLSRQEVTEDLQTIGSLMKALGKSWQPKFTRRNAGRNGLNSQSRGRRRPRNLAITVAETDASPLQLQPTRAEPVADGMPMVGWGRTTRRCRRQRCLPVNVTALT